VIGDARTTHRRIESPASAGLSTSVKPGACVPESEIAICGDFRLRANGARRRTSPLILTRARVRLKRPPNPRRGGGIHASGHGGRAWLTLRARDAVRPPRVPRFASARRRGPRGRRGWGPVSSRRVTNARSAPMSACFLQVVFGEFAREFASQRTRWPVVRLWLQAPTTRDESRGERERRHATSAAAASEPATELSWKPVKP
jgi:hypothetical protein